MLTEKELAYQIATGNENVTLDECVTSIETPLIEVRIMMIHSALINRMESSSIKMEEIDWSSFMDSIFEINDGIDFINRIKSKQLRIDILNYWIDNYDKIVGNEWRRVWISEWKNLRDNQ